MTTFYLARPLQAHALSAAVGSGKTRAAVAHMARPANAARNFLYVAPTIDLGTQTAGNLREAIAATAGPLVRNVHLVNSRTVEGKTRVEALRAINEVHSEEGQVHVLTTQTLLDILAGIQRPHLWSVILDEAFSPATFETFGLGADVHEGWAYFREVFDIDPEQGHRILPNEGRKQLVADLADGRLTRAGGKYEGLQKVAKAVSNPASRCELVVTPRVAALLAGAPLPVKRTESAESVLEYASYIAPEYFSGFREVLFLSALFEQTVLFHLWTKALGVTFHSHPEFPAEMLRDTHGEQGRFLAVGHLLHKDDTSSKENLGRNLHTGMPGEKVPGQRVLDHVIRTASAHFGDSRFLLQVNNGTGYEEGRALVPRNATVIPAHAHGLNCFQDVDNVAALCVTNPNPQQLAWVRGRTGMTAREVTQSFRIHTAYQALGRCSIRKAEQTTDSKTVLVAGADDARFLQSLFHGCLWLGQVGDLPSMKATAAKADRREGGKVKALAASILQHLQALQGIDRISSRALREALEKSDACTLSPKVQMSGFSALEKSDACTLSPKVQMSGFSALEKSDACTLSPKVQMSGFSALEKSDACTLSPKVQMTTLNESDRQTWTRAVSGACAAGSGWRRDGGSIVRVLAEDYGFQTAEAA